MISATLKQRFIKIISVFLLLYLCAPVLAGCGGDTEMTEAGPADITTVTVTDTKEITTGTEAAATDTEPAATDTQTDADGTAAAPDTESAATEPVTTEEQTTEPEMTAPETTEPETTAPETTAPETTEPVTTEPETTAPAPLEPLDVIKVGADNAADLLKFFSRERYCKAEAADDESEGKAIRITTRGVISANTACPVIYFDYKGYCASVGKANVNVAEAPFVVLKVRLVDAHDRRFGLLGLAEPGESAATRTEIYTVVPSSGKWSYICFDFSKATRPDDIGTFRIDFEQNAGGNGESVLISEIRVCTKAEAEKLVTPDVYPILDQTTIRLLQFNIQTENGNNAPFIVRAELYRRLLDELMPDVVGMEEVTTTWRKWLDEYVFNDSYASVGEPRSAGGEANPIYYRKDKYELVDSGTFWLSDTPDKVGSLTSVVVEEKEYKSNYPRICTWAVLRDKATGTRFIHMNTHLDHNGNNSSSVGNNIRKAQIKVIIKFAQKYKDMPMFLSGDLNNRRTTGEGKTYALIKMISGQSVIKEEDGTTYSIALSDSRLDAPVTVDENHTATMTKYYDESSSAYEPTREPIDYVFYNKENTDALTYETFLISRDGLWISDHLPVFTTFRLK
ncbi:MAG: endonuclease/exonuclease/phosphatase family protein [Clostridia bacterium]|nr:endonuclease/exonuclease/phosphatase family protein [Clostridia bacterium]